MNADDLAKVKEAMGVPSDERWRTPSGAFLGLLRQFAREEKIAEIADACQMYFSEYRGSQNFVASALPAIILNHYHPLTRGVTFKRIPHMVRPECGLVGSDPRPCVLIQTRISH